MKLPSRTQLSKEQERIYQSAPLTGTTIITGPPGTGKTILAVYRAMLLSKKKQEFDLVMFNHVLRQYTTQSFDDHLKGSIRTWHSWFYVKWWQNANPGRNGLKMPEVEKFQPNFEQLFGIISQVALKERLGWNHLIIDEGQDFPPHFYVLLRIIQSSNEYGSNNAKSLTILADDNQRLEKDRNSRIKQIYQSLNIPKEDVRKLSINFRNTKQIAMLSEIFYVGDIEDLPERPERNGEKPQLEKFNSFNDEVERICTYAKMNLDLDIGVFCKDRILMNRFYSQLSERIGDEIKVQNYVDKRSKLVFDSQGSITILCDKSVKGIEFDTVFVPQLQLYLIDGIHEEFIKMKFYVITTRARTDLFFSFTDAINAPEVLELFPSKESGLIEYKGF